MKKKIQKILIWIFEFILWIFLYFIRESGVWTWLWGNSKQGTGN